MARRNVLHTVRKIRNNSRTLDRLVQAGNILIVGCMYDVSTGRVEFLSEATTPEREPDRLLDASPIVAK